MNIVFEVVWAIAAFYAQCSANLHFVAWFYGCATVFQPLLVVM